MENRTRQGSPASGVARSRRELNGRLGLERISMKIGSLIRSRGPGRRRLPKWGGLAALCLCLLAVESAWGADIYVAVGGVGDGSQANPYGSIQTAVNAAQPLDTIHLGAGTFNESVIINGRNDLTIIGAGIGTTRIRPVEINGVLVQLSSAIQITDLWVENLSASGRGFVNKGAHLTLERVSTSNTSHEGVLVVEFMGVQPTIVLNDCQIDGSQLSAGLVTQNGVSSVQANNTSFNGHGTGTCDPCAPQFGRGMVIFSADTLTLNNCQFDNNLDSGIKIDATTPVVFSMTGGSASDNLSNGLGIDGTVECDIRDADFSRNGPVPRDPPNTGRNGIEFFVDYIGNALVENCDFVSNTLNGIFIGSGNVDVYDSTFDDNHTGMTVSSVITNSTINMDIFGNLIQMESGYMDSPNGIVFNGDGITAVLGSQDCAEANTFINIRDMSAVVCFAGATLLLGKNQYIDSPNPIRHCEPNPPPSCGCEAEYDLTGLGNVNLDDLLFALPQWRAVNLLIPDANDNGVMDVADLSEMVNCISSQ